MLGFDLKPRSHHHGEGPGLLGAAIYSAISWTEPHHAVSRTWRWMSLPAKLSRDGSMSRVLAGTSLNWALNVPSCRQLPPPKREIGLLRTQPEFDVRSIASCTMA